MRVKVMVKNNQKTIKVPVGIRMLIRRCCQAVLVMEQFPHDAEVSVSFVSNAEIRNLNRIYRKKRQCDGRALVPARRRRKV